MLSLIFLFCLAFPISSSLHAQKPVSDLCLLKNNPSEISSAYPVRGFMVTQASKPTVKYNPIAYLAGGAMYFYQNAVSPQFSASCLYQPGCSDFSKELVNKFGLFRGVLFTADRLTRCNRVSGLGIRGFERDIHTHRVIETTHYYEW